MTKKNKNDRKGFSEAQAPVEGHTPPSGTLKKGKISTCFESALKAVETIGQKKPN